MERALKRWAIANKLYLGLFFLIAIFAYIDSKQIIPFLKINTQEAWALYTQYTMPSFIVLWIIVIGIAALVYYFFSKDKSEAVGIAGAGFIMLFTGLEDVFYFAFSVQEMTPCMSWLNDLGAPVAWYSTNILREACVSPAALISFSILGIVAAYFVFNKLKKAKW